MRLVTRAHHHGYRDGAVDDYVGDRAARDRPEEGTGQNRDLGGAAPEPSHQRQGQIGEKLTSAKAKENLAEENEGNDHRRYDR